MARLELEHVEKTYAGGVRAIVDLDLVVADRELLALVGPSGCGKSTVLRCIAGLEPVSRGTVRIGERVVNDLSPQERNVAMVFQDYALYPFMTVRANLEFPLKMRRMPRAERARRVMEVAEMLEIAPLLDRLPKQLSGGQRQRVAMGRALVRDPALSLLDEPLSNLDARLRAQVRAEIAELQSRTGATMIYVTHDQVEAMTLGQRVAVLDRGELQQVGPPREIYDNPVNRFVAGFIGNPPMNLLPATLAAEPPARLALVIAEQRIALEDPALVREMQPLAGKSVTAGVRPEGLELARDEDAQALRARVTHVEHLGHEILAHARLGPATLIARLPAGDPLHPGDPLPLRIRPGALYFFDAEGRRCGGGVPQTRS